MNPQIGARIRTLRKEKKLTLTEMSEMTDLSLGFLSKLENDQTSPTIAHLHKVCNALNITLNDILDLDAEVDKNRVTVVRVQERKTVFEQDDGDLKYDAMTLNGGHIKVTSMTISGEKTYAFTPHDHDELGIVIQGVLEMQIGEKKYFLHPGDTIYIHENTMHSGRRASDELCISYWVKVT